MKTRYSVHPGVKMIQDWVASLPTKTGKSLDSWVELLKAEGPQDVQAQKVWLKEVHHFWDQRRLVDHRLRRRKIALGRRSRIISTRRREICGADVCWP